MKFKINIAWIDDNYSWYENSKQDIEKYIKDKHYICEIDYFSELTDDIIDSLKSKTYDLMLIDYFLGHNQKGNMIISKIRSEGIFTDIIFYSSSYEDFINSLKDLALDGVYYSERKEQQLYNKIHGVLDKIINREQKINNLRGNVLASTSYFDERIIQLIGLIYGKINDEEKIKIDNEVKKICIESKKGMNKNYDEVINNTNFDFNNFLNNSKGYIIDSYKKSKILKYILNSILLDDYHYQEFDQFKDMHNFYVENINKKRNILGHVNFDGYPPYVYNDGSEQIEVNEEFKDTLRGNIFKYNQLLEQLEKRILELP